MHTTALSREQVEHAARIYHQGGDASRALGITPRSFTRLCRKFGIETPWMRKRRAHSEARTRG